MPIATGYPIYNCIFSYNSIEYLILLFDTCIWKDNLDNLDGTEDDEELFKNQIVVEFGKKYLIPLIISTSPKKGKIS